MWSACCEPAEPAEHAESAEAGDAGDASSTDYESSDDEWRPPFIDAETGESAFDEETGTFPYGTLSFTAPTIASPDGVTRRFLEMIRDENGKPDQKQQPVRLPTFFVDIGCGKGRVVNKVASDLGIRCVDVDISQKELEVAAEGARTLGVASQVSFAVRDFRQFHMEIPIFFFK